MHLCENFFWANQRVSSIIFSDLEGDTKSVLQSYHLTVANYIISVLSTSIMVFSICTECASNSDPGQENLSFLCHHFLCTQRNPSLSFSSFFCKTSSKMALFTTNVMYVCSIKSYNAKLCIPQVLPF